MVEPLRLALHPVVPVRTPRQGRPTVIYGYQLRLADGLALAHDDALLSAFAASVEAVEGEGSDSEPLQADALDPGQPVRLIREGVDDDGDDVIGVWNADETHRAGALPYQAAARIAAASDHGLEMDAFVLSEIRNRFDDRRAGIAVFVYPPDLVSVDISAGGPLQRPEKRARPRLVLMSDEAGGLRWWDPSGHAGPMELDAVPVSPPLANELRELEQAFKAVASTSPDLGDADLMSDMEHGYRQHMLSTRTRNAWVRLRRELGRRYAVGILLNGMHKPVWSPDDWEDSDEDEDDEIPF